MNATFDSDYMSCGGEGGGKEGEGGGKEGEGAEGKLEGRNR